jgi:tRNA-dihydrouridine synthase 1
VPVFANGNILHTSDIERCLAETGADGVMSAEGQLYNAAIFASAASTEPEETKLLLEHPPHADLALEYLDIVQGLKTKTAVSAVKGHLFKLLKPALMKETDLRDKLGKIQIDRNIDASKGSLQPYVDICKEMKERMDVSHANITRHCFYSYYLSLQRDQKEAGEVPVITFNEATGLASVPHWLAQSYVRPPPPPPVLCMCSIVVYFSK